LKEGESMKEATHRGKVVLEKGKCFLEVEGRRWELEAGGIIVDAII